MAALTLRRLRDNRHIRELTREVRVHPEQFIQPLFVVEGIAGREPVPGLRDVHRDTPDTLLRQVEADLGQGIAKFLLFGVPATKTERNFRHDFTSAQLGSLRRRFGADIWLAADVCLCSYTTHGHCGILNDQHDHVENAVSVEALAAAAREFAAAGADCVAPSDMLDGRVAAIRAALATADLERTIVMSYAAKFHSAFYGPFRLAADSAPGTDVPLRDRATYQLDPARPGDALLSARRDDAEGADILMVKPGLPYLDIVRRVKDTFALPTFAFQVSGEYAMIKAACANGWLDEDRAIVETLSAFKRAGCDGVVTYFALRAAKLL